MFFWFSLLATSTYTVTQFYFTCYQWSLQINCERAGLLSAARIASLEYLVSKGRTTMFDFKTEVCEWRKVLDYIVTESLLQDETRCVEQTLLPNDLDL